MHNKILSLFNYNLETDFIKSVSEPVSEVNFQGAYISNFSKKFPDNTFYIFETIIVKDFGLYSNIFLKSKTYSLSKLYRYKKLINALFKIYGPDDLKGKYSIQDFRDLSDKEMDYCPIRNWSGIENELLPCDLAINKTEKVAELRIFGATISPEIKGSW